MNQLILASLALTLFTLSVSAEEEMAEQPSAGPGNATFCKISCTGLKPVLLDQAVLSGNKDKKDEFVQSCGAKGGKIIQQREVSRTRRDLLGCSLPANSSKNLTYCIGYSESRANGTALNPYYFAGVIEEVKESCVANLSLFGCTSYGDTDLNERGRVEPQNVSFSEPECIEVE